MDEFDESQPASRLKPSKTPSWIMLGFILGAFFVWALPRPRETNAPLTPARPVEVEFKPEPVPTHSRFSDVEALFAEWGRYAVWADDTTYIGMWDIESKSFRDCFEVLRRGNTLYFRSIDRPRNLRTLGVPDVVPKDSPLEFFNPVAETRGFFGPPRLVPPERTTDVRGAVSPPPLKPLPLESIPVEVKPPPKP